MPELPEVETIARQLDQVIVGKKIAKVVVLSTKSFLGDSRELIGKKIDKVDRHAKMVVWHLDDAGRSVMIHLKMTGQLVWRPAAAGRPKKDNIKEGEYKGRQVVGGHPSEDWNLDLPNKHTRVVIDFADGSRLFFNDLRKFGWIKLVKSEELAKALIKMPPDIIDSVFTLEFFSKVLASSRRAVKLVLMDQAKIGGVGNIYANDALNLAKVDPGRAANSLQSFELKKLYLGTRKVINLGIKYGGATYSDYRDTRGQGGRYQEHFLVYDREGEKCHNCGGTIKKIHLGGRGTYFCPKCQK